MIALHLSVEALPYTLLLLIGQFTAGCALLTLFAQVRGTYEPGFIRTCSWIVVFSAGLTAVVALAVDERSVVDGFALDGGALNPIRGLVVAMLLFAVVYLYFLRREDEPFLATATGVTTVALGLISLILMAQLVHIPTWSVVGATLTMLAGALTLGAVTIAMIWGHWYLVNPRLPAEPMNEMALITLGAIVVQLAITTINAAIPVGQEVATDALLAIDLPQNPAFWLRIGVGLIFPAALAFMAYKSSQEGAMMSATGLLYIAVGAVLAGEAVGRGLLFVTAAPV
jgi:hypothetical protein